MPRKRHLQQQQPPLAAERPPPLQRPLMLLQRLPLPPPLPNQHQQQRRRQRSRGLIFQTPVTPPQGVGAQLAGPLGAATRAEPAAVGRGGARPLPPTLPSLERRHLPPPEAVERGASPCATLPLLGAAAVAVVGHVPQQPWVKAALPAQALGRGHSALQLTPTWTKRTTPLWPAGGAAPLWRATFRVFSVRALPLPLPPTPPRPPPPH